MTSLSARPRCTSRKTISENRRGTTPSAQHNNKQNLCELVITSGFCQIAWPPLLLYKTFPRQKPPVRQQHGQTRRLRPFPDLQRPGGLLPARRGPAPGSGRWRFSFGVEEGQLIVFASGRLLVRSKRGTCSGFLSNAVKRTLCTAHCRAIRRRRGVCKGRTCVCVRWRF